MYGTVYAVTFKRLSIRRHTHAYASGTQGSRARITAHACTKKVNTYFAAVVKTFEEKVFMRRTARRSLNLPSKKEQKKCEGEKKDLGGGGADAVAGGAAEDLLCCDTIGYLKGKEL